MEAPQKILDKIRIKGTSKVGRLTEKYKRKYITSYLLG
jgi:hypothetical protein